MTGDDDDDDDDDNHDNDEEGRRWWQRGSRTRLPRTGHNRNRTGGTRARWAFPESAATPGGRVPWREAVGGREGSRR